MKYWLTFASFWFGCIFTVTIIDCSRNLLEGDITKILEKGTFHKVQHNGHDYILYEVGRKGSRMGGFDHDPDCQKCKGNK
jgi:hypothetical protein